MKFPSPLRYLTCLSLVSASRHPIQCGQRAIDHRVPHGRGRPPEFAACPQLGQEVGILESAVAHGAAQAERLISEDARTMKLFTAAADYSKF